MYQTFDEAIYKTYSSTVAAMLCNDFFAEKNTITGSEILNFSQIDQVNTFIIKHLFEKWQATTSQLQSPFFDFGHEKVQLALQNFMNVVSQYIAVKKADFMPLVAAAIQDTLHLAIAPASYVAQNQNPDTYKYNRLHSRYWSYTKNALANGETWPEIQAQNKEELLDDTEPILSTLGQILSLPKGLNTSQVAIPATEAPQSFFENLPTPSPSAEQPAQEPSPEKPKIKIKAEVQQNQEATTTLHEHFLDSSPTLNDQHQSEAPNIASLHQQAPIKDLATAVSLNQKFIFINKLFQGDSAAYQEVISTLSTCSTADEALNLLRYRYAPKYKWDQNSSEADELMDIIKRMQ
jgi:hypothetical protein